MQRGRLVTMTVIGLICVIAVGCGPDPKDLQIQQLSEERDGLRNDLDHRDQMLQEAGDRESYAQQTIDSLRGQMTDLEGKLVDASKPRPDADGWIGMPGFDMISIPGEVLFDSGKSALRRDGRRALDRIASDLRGQYSEREIYVFGHTDDDPIRKSGWKDNWELGSERALTIVRHLVSQGVSPSQIVASSCGEFRPRASNGSAVGKKKNRRVEFYAVVPKGGELGSAQASTISP